MTAIAVIPNPFSVCILMGPRSVLSQSWKGREEHQEHPVILNNLLLKALPNSSIGPTDDIQGFYIIRCPLALSCAGSLFLNWIASAVFYMMNGENINLAVSSVLCDMVTAGQGSWEPPWHSNGESESQESKGPMRISLRIQFNTQRSKYVVLFQFESAI